MTVTDDDDGDRCDGKCVQVITAKDINLNCHRKKYQFGLKLAEPVLPKLPNLAGGARCAGALRLVCYNPI